MDTPPRAPYPTDVSDNEWVFLAHYLPLMRENAPQRTHSLRGLFNGLCYIAQTGLQWRFIPNDLTPWAAVYQQTRRWIDTEVFEAMILDTRTLQSTPESGARAGWDGAKRRKGTKVRLAVDTPGQLLALHVTPTNEQDRAQVAEVADAVQAETDETVELAYVDQGCTREAPRQAAADHGIQLEVAKLPQAKRGFVLLPRRLVVERDFGWMSRFRRLARD